MVSYLSSLSQPQHTEALQKSIEKEEVCMSSGTPLYKFLSSLMFSIGWKIAQIVNIVVLVICIIE